MSFNNKSTGKLSFSYNLQILKLHNKVYDRIDYPVCQSAYTFSF